MSTRLGRQANIKVCAATFAGLFLAAIIPVTLVAQAPGTISFQGKLTDTGGTPTNATVQMTFTLYKGATDVWTETQPSVQVADGVFNVLLGSVTPLDTVAFNQPIDLGIAVGGDPEIAPRTPLVASAFSLGMRGMYAELAEQFDKRGFNVIGGWNNPVAPGIVSATIAGGGGQDFFGDPRNTVTADWGAVGGGYGNTAGWFATVAGGRVNKALGNFSTVPGGGSNEAHGWYSFAAGQRAQAFHGGTFVWADTTEADFASTGGNQFLIRASGGVGIGTNNPGNHSLAIIDNDPGGIPGASLEVDNNSTGNGIAAHFETSGTDATLVIDQDGTGDHIKTFDNGDLRFRVADNGNVTADGSFTGSGADLAEAIAVEGPKEEYEAGDVLVVSTSRNRTVSLSREPYSKLVAGVYATKPGVVMTDRGISEDFSGRVPVGVVGIVPTKVSAENGPIQRGDLLVTSSTPGHAMRADPVVVGGVELYPNGAILGKAFEPFDGPGKGVIEVLVMPR